MRSIHFVAMATLHASTTYKPKLVSPAGGEYYSFKNCQNRCTNLTSAWMQRRAPPSSGAGTLSDKGKAGSSMPGKEQLGLV